MTRTPEPRSRWLLCRKRRPAAHTRLYCFPHSGGSPGEYLRWSDRLVEIEVWGVQLPGRGQRATEPPYATMPKLVDAIVSEIDFAAPFVFFGHSLGALVAYETAVEMRRRGTTGPMALLLSGYEAPHLRSPLAPLHELDAVALLEAIDESYGTVPAEARNDPELAELMVGALRADLRIVRTYEPSDADPLSCPIVVLGGTQDDFPESALAAWDRYTIRDYELQMFPGGHFYFRERTADVLGYLADKIDNLAHGAVHPPG